MSRLVLGIAALVIILMTMTFTSAVAWPNGNAGRGALPPTTVSFVVSADISTAHVSSAIPIIAKLHGKGTAGIPNAIGADLADIAADPAHAAVRDVMFSLHGPDDVGDIYVAAMADGELCYVSTTDSGACAFEVNPVAATWGATTIADETHAYVWGMASDAVQSISIAFDDRRSIVVPVQNNAFGLDLPRDSDLRHVKGLLASLATGGTRLVSHPLLATGDATS